MSVVRFVSHAKIPRDALPGVKRKALDAAGLTVAGTSAELTPVETGRLRSSITHELVSDSEVHVGTNVEYAIYVHENMQAAHTMGQSKFISTAIEQEERTVQQLVKDALEGRL